jgi:hypothetical protein
MLLCTWAHCGPRLTAARAGLAQLVGPTSQPFAAHSTPEHGQCMPVCGHRIGARLAHVGLNGARSTIIDEVDGNTISRT